MIRRAEHSTDKRFTIISRSLAQDKSLTFQARGLLVYVLSKPPKWKASYDELRRAGSIGRTALDNIVKELLAAGYIRRHRERGEDGKLAWVMEVFESPSEDSTSARPHTLETSARPAAVVKRALAIDSTGAGARSSSDLTDLRDREPLKRSHKPPEPEILIDPPFHGKDFMLALTKYETVKKEIRSPLTPTSREALYCKLAKFDEDTATLALEEAAAGGYKGVFPSKAKGNGNGNGKFHEQPYTGPVASRPDPVKENCPDCRGLGTVYRVVDGIEYADNCKHRGRAHVA